MANPNSIEPFSEEPRHGAPAAFILPEFDSAPATAGLTNLEAFHLSIRHALALLPTLAAKGMDARRDEDYSERFRML
jgi:hypothetical protein